MKKYFFPFLRDIEYIIDTLLQEFIDENDMKLTVKEFNVIEMIKKLKKTNSNTTTNVSQALNLSASAISITVKKLESKGFIFRHHDIDDRRVVYISLTANTNIFIDKIIEKRNYFVLKAFDGIEHKEEKEFIATLAKISSNTKSILNSSKFKR